MPKFLKTDIPLGIRGWGMFHLVLGILVFMQSGQIAKRYNETEPASFLFFDLSAPEFKAVIIALCAFSVVLGLTTLSRSGFGWVLCLGELFYLIYLTAFDIIKLLLTNQTFLIAKKMIALAIIQLVIWYLTTEKVRNYFHLGVKFPKKPFAAGVVVGLLLIAIQFVVVWVV